MLEAVADQIAPRILHANTQRWQTIEINAEMSDRAKIAAARLNSLGSLFWFSKFTLRHSRLSPNLHGYLCGELERDSLRLALEVPRDMFKTTIASVSAPIWWALPFNERDEELMRQLGYGDAWIRWMQRAHDTCTRTLIASEIIDNAVKIGVRIASQYESNSLFRELFSEIIPRGSDEMRGPAKEKKKWNLKSMTHRRLGMEHHGEGTYDLIGVKGALQSRHYKRQVIDDPVGEKAVNSDLVMEATTDWIQKLPGALDSDPLDPNKLEDQLFIGNRWSMRDVGAWLRKNMPSMQFITHSAEGGCCDRHPPGQSIFPEEFSMGKLAQLRQIWGSYNYSSQYLNNPIDPEAVRFKRGWLRHYAINPFEGTMGVSIANAQQMRDVPNPAEVMKRQEREELAGAIPARLKVGIHHETQSGEVIDDIRAGVLDRVAILDPNHSGERGRSRHAIVVLGMYNNPPAPRRIYLLETWAGATSFDEMISRLIGMQPGKLGLALKWRVHHIYMESEVAGQQGWLRFFQDRLRAMGPAASFGIRGLETDRSANGKDKRIIGMEPIYENGLFWVPRQGNGVDQFLQEYETFPNGATKDILDVIGYSPQTWQTGSRMQTRDFVREELNRRSVMMQSVGQAGY